MTHSTPPHGFSQTQLRRAARHALNLVLPPRCLRCGAMVEATGTLCAGCWDRIDFIGPPFCARCGFPFEFDVADGALCSGCVRRSPAFARARSVLRYDDESRELILAFKYRDRTDAAPAFGRWLARVGAELLADADLVVPVPLHWSRLFQRRYNQAALLAKGVARAAGLPAVPVGLARCRRTPSQGGLNASARRRNVRGAFAVSRDAALGLRDRAVVLVDDVMTTGATVEECARALIAAGARRVEVLTLARVVRPAP